MGHAICHEHTNTIAFKHSRLCDIASFRGNGALTMVRRMDKPAVHTGRSQKSPRVDEYILSQLEL
jgi:hypothetical protein